VRSSGWRILHALRISEVLGFRGQAAELSSSTSPLHMLAGKAHVSPLGMLSTAAPFVSMFACVLACATAAARVLLRMAHDKLLPSALQRTTPRHGTPGTAVILSIALMFAATAAMAILGDTGRRCTICWDRFRIWLPHRVCAGRSRTSLCAARSRAALTSSRGRQRPYSRGHLDHRDLRPQLRRGRRSRANSLSLSRLHHRRARLLCNAAKKSPNRVICCGKAVPYLALHTKFLT